MTLLNSDTGVHAHEGKGLGTIFVLSYPFVAIGTSTLWFAACKLDHLTSLWAARPNRESVLAMLITAARSELAAIRYGTYALFVTQLSCFFLALWVLDL